MRPYVYLCLLFLPVANASAQSYKHDLFDRVLQRFVNDKGMVDYKNLKVHAQDLQDYVAQIAKHSPGNAPDLFQTDEARLAYWLNTYNALAMHSVVEAYPVKSVRDIKWFYGFFNRTKHVVGGQKFTLKYIEHEIIRNKFPDPRIHAGLNCASVGCPRLPQSAFLPETLDADLDAYMREFLREDRNVKIDREKGRIYLSEILKDFEDDFTFWYNREFKVENATILNYLKLYLPKDESDFLTAVPDLDIRYFKYDWRLNDQELVK